MQAFFVECFMKDGTVNSFMDVVLPAVPPIGTTVRLIFPQGNDGDRYHGYITAKVLEVKEGQSVCSASHIDSKIENIRMTQESPNIFLALRENERE